MSLVLGEELLREICQHGEQAYPEEGAGFLLGTEGEHRSIKDIIPLPNAHEAGARHNRYLITPEDFLKAETKAEERSLSVLGVFHSHPDHPDDPSEFDREWAQPGFSYLITSIESGNALGTKSWRLTEDRGRFIEEEVTIVQSE